TQYRSAWNYIEDRAREQNDSEGNDSRLGISKLDRSLHNRRRLCQFRSAVHQQEQRRQPAHYPSRPKSLPGNWSDLSIRLHLTPLVLRLLAYFSGRPGSSITCRISTVPMRAPGIRAAMPMASSTLSAVI